MTRQGLPATRSEVEAALAKDVLPYVRNHGGDVRVLDVAPNGAVTCSLEGACRGCPAAPVTAIAVIERALRERLGADVVVRVPQLSISPHATERIRRFFPARRACA